MHSQSKPIDDCCKNKSCSSKPYDKQIINQETNIIINENDILEQKNSSELTNKIDLNPNVDINSISLIKNYTHIEMFHELRILT